MIEHQITCLSGIYSFIYILWNPIIETAKIQVQRSDYMTFVFPTTVPSLCKVVLYKPIILPETHIITLDPRDKWLSYNCHVLLHRLQLSVKTKTGCSSCTSFYFIPDRLHTIDVSTHSHQRCYIKRYLGVFRYDTPNHDLSYLAFHSPNVPGLL